MVYTKKAYKSLTKAQMKVGIEKEGFDPIEITNEPGFVYHPHSHPETKLLAFLSGSMTLKVADQTYECKEGDKLIIQCNITHSATVGPGGCTFFWSEKLL